MKREMKREVRRRDADAGPRGRGAQRTTAPVPRAGGQHTPPIRTLTIGALAARAGVTPEAVRYYEREGVIPPAVRAGAGRYRAYTEADAERLRFVRRARDLGFRLDEVRELLALAAGDRGRPEGRSCAEVNRIASAHLAQVDAKLAQLRAMRGELARLVAACDRDAAVTDCSLLGALSGVPAVRG